MATGGGKQPTFRTAQAQHTAGTADGVPPCTVSSTVSSRLLCKAMNPLLICPPVMQGWGPKCDPVPIQVCSVS